MQQSSNKLHVIVRKIVSKKGMRQKSICECVFDSVRSENNVFLH